MISDKKRKDFLQFKDRALSYSHYQGHKNLGFLWLGGYRSDINGKKAQFLEYFCQKEGYSYLAFDYSGHGESKGDFSQGTLSDWLAESLFFYEKFCTASPQIIIGSSMGGWLALRLYQMLKQKSANIKALILIAPAPDFTLELLEKDLTPDQQNRLITDGVLVQDSPYDPEGVPFFKKFIDDGRKHLVLNQLLEVNCPIFILQGQQDTSVPYTHALKLMESLPYNKAHLTFVKDGDHSLSRPQDLELLEKTIMTALQTIIENPDEPLNFV